MRIFSEKSNGEDPPETDENKKQEIEQKKAKIDTKIEKLKQNELDLKTFNQKLFEEIKFSL